MIFKTNSNRFQDLSIELAALELLKENRNKSIQRKNINFNWGIIWTSVSPLIIVAGWAILLGLGIRGTDYDLSYFAFLVMFGLGFNKVVTKCINFKIDPILLNKKFINILNISYGIFISELAPLILRFFILLLVLNLLNFEFEYFYLISGGLLIIILAFLYGLTLKSIFSKNSFFIDTHVYFLQAVFLTSSIIFPVSRLPESIRDIFLYNPLAHINEWIKSATTGIKYEYIDMSYPITLLIILIITIPIFLWFINKNEDKN